MRPSIILVAVMAVGGACGKIGFAIERDAGDDADPSQCGTIEVTLVQDFADSKDHQGIVAVAGGRANFTFGGGDYPNAWTQEQVKPFTTLADYLQSPVANTPITASACVAPGTYALQYWDIWGGDGSFDNGIPPTVTYVWQIGASSRELVVTAGVALAIGLLATQTVNVPNNNFYGTWGHWDYGACADGCPVDTTCEPTSDRCVDLAYDARYCGSLAGGCTNQDCCDRACVDITSDPANCGACGVVCGSGQCVSSACQ